MYAIRSYYVFELTGNDLRMTASDLEISMTVVVPVSGEGDGKVAVPAKKFNETLRALPNVDLAFASDDASNRLTIKTDLGEYKMAGENAGNFPEAEGIQEEFSLQIDTDILKGIIARTVYAVSTDDLRPSMMGVLFQWKGEEFVITSYSIHYTKLYEDDMQRLRGNDDIAVAFRVCFGERPAVLDAHETVPVGRDRIELFALPLEQDS